MVTWPTMPPVGIVVVALVAAPVATLLVVALAVLLLAAMIARSAKSVDVSITLRHNASTAMT
jgi:hypothetical protein